MINSVTDKEFSCDVFGIGYWDLDFIKKYYVNVTDQTAILPPDSNRADWSFRATFNFDWQSKNCSAFRR